MRETLQQRIEELGLTDAVRITGWISGAQVREEILQARALVLPSFAEGLPVVLMEAMALSRPVISTYVGGIPELVLDGKTGWLVPPGDVDSLAQAMLHCLDASEEQLRAMGEAGRQRVQVRHDVQKESSRLKALLAQVR
jgi:glycosyltransferase involved in cell wall biosynthesis